MPMRNKLRSISVSLALCKLAGTSTSHWVVGPGRDRHLFASRKIARVTTQKLFASTRGKHVGSVEEVDADLDRFSDQRTALVFGNMSIRTGH